MTLASGRAVIPFLLCALCSIFTWEGGFFRAILLFTSIYISSLHLLLCTDILKNNGLRLPDGIQLTGISQSIHRLLSGEKKITVRVFFH